MNEAIIKQLKDFSILCVEDEDGIRKRLINTLKYYFTDIYEAKSGNEAYDIYLEYKPNIIITDIQMNDGDGISLVRKIRTNDFYTKIIMLTAYSTEEYLFDLINYKIDHFILKPLNADALLEGIIQALGDEINQVIKIAQNLYLNLDKRELTFKNEHILLRKREKDFLLLLYKNKKSCISTYSQIEDKVWDNKYMSANALKTFIKDLRKKLPLDIIINIPQSGYKLK